MSLEELLMEDQKEATRAKDRFRLTVIRNLRAELKNAAIARRAVLSSDEELTVLMREVKQRQEALADYERAGRPDLLAGLKQEIKLLYQYLPEQLSEAYLEEIVSQALRDSGASSPKDIGKVMALVMPQVKGRADGAAVRKLAEQKIHEL